MPNAIGLALVAVLLLTSSDACDLRPGRGWFAARVALLLIGGVIGWTAFFLAAGGAR